METGTNINFIASPSSSEVEAAGMLAQLVEATFPPVSNPPLRPGLAWCGGVE